MSVRPNTIEITDRYVEQRFPEVVERIRKANWPIRHATAVSWMREALHFLDACAESEDLIAPSKRVDKAWHEFLLYTHLYTQWCELRYGRYIHHMPSGRPDGGAYRRAYALLTARHGRLDSRIWPHPRRSARYAGGGAACGWVDGGGGGDGGGASCGGGSSCGGGGCGGGGG